MDASTRTFFIAGVRFYKGMLAFVEDEPTLPIPVPLIGEPSNKYDRYAIRIEYARPDSTRIQLGHVPKPVNLDIWALRDAGYKPTAHVIEFSRTAPTHLMFKVEVTFSK